MDYKMKREELKKRIEELNREIDECIERTKKVLEKR